MEIKFEDWELDSEEELYFCHWLAELQERNMIESFFRVTEPITIFDKVNFDFNIREKSTVKQISKFILHPLTYTPDFLINWNKAADGKIMARTGETYSKASFNQCEFYTDSYSSIVDVKGAYSHAKLVTSITFPVLQKVLAYNKGIYVQKVMPLAKAGLFAKTFTPAAYLNTKTGKKRKITWEVRDVDNYLNNLI